MNIINNNLQWLLRIPLIGVFLSSGYPKLGNEVASLGFIGYLVGPFEFFGAIFLLVGSFIKYKFQIKKYHIDLNDKIHRIGAYMIAIIMVGTLYMHLVKWNHTLSDVTFNILLLSVALYIAIKDCSKLFPSNE